MNRFHIQRNDPLHQIWIVVSSFFFIFIFLLFLFFILNMKGSSSDAQKIRLEENIHKGIAQCYALEGTYPPDLSYLEEHYGLVYNHNLFYVDYVSIGSNIFPDVTVITMDRR